MSKYIKQTPYIEVYDKITKKYKIYQTISGASKAIGCSQSYLLKALDIDYSAFEMRYASNAISIADDVSNAIGVTDAVNIEVNWSLVK